MRNISFALTTPQFLANQKTVTRRVGWANLRLGTLLMACRKCQGIRPGEKIERLGVIAVSSVRRERLDAISTRDVIREGFPEMSPDEFVDMFCKHMKVEPSAFVTRIEFKRIQDESEARS